MSLYIQQHNVLHVKNEVPAQTPNISWSRSEGFVTPFSSGGELVNDARKGKLLTKINVDAFDWIWNRNIYIIQLRAVEQGGVPNIANDDV